MKSMAVEQERWGKPLSGQIVASELCMAAELPTTWQAPKTARDNLAHEHAMLWAHKAATQPHGSNPICWYNSCRSQDHCKPVLRATTNPYTFKSSLHNPMQLTNTLSRKRICIRFNKKRGINHSKYSSPLKMAHTRHFRHVSTKWNAFSSS